MKVETLHWPNPLRALFERHINKKLSKAETEVSELKTILATTDRNEITNEPIDNQNVTPSNESPTITEYPRAIIVR